MSPNVNRKQKNRQKGEGGKAEYGIYQAWVWKAKYGKPRNTRHTCGNRARRAGRRGKICILSVSGV
ncbi:MAG: hypothetical protein CW338_03005 [Clostridiales bacterium]|nr:hypothetical protein [Clostridiales bacterium]